MSDDTQTKMAKYASEFKERALNDLLADLNAAAEVLLKNPEHHKLAAAVGVAGSLLDRTVIDRAFDLGRGAGVKDYDDLANRCKASAIRLKTLSLRLGPVSSDLAEAASLLRLMWLMLIDDEPLTDWGEIDFELRQILSRSESKEDQRTLSDLRKLLRKVSGE